MTPLKLYLVGTSAWFLAFGIQSVLFSWLVTIVLHESARRVGLAHMSQLVPTVLLMLVGGSLADHYGGRRLLVIAQSAAALPPIFLASCVALGALEFDAIVAYALAMGLATAFLTPARDALLNEVAEASIQRTVVSASFVQFGAQIAGFLIASCADAVGPLPIFALQIAALLGGAFILSRVPIATHARAHETHTLQRLIGSVLEGARTVFSEREMRITVLQNVAMGACFMGSYIVTLPLLIREVYGGSARDLGFLNTANSLGLLATSLVLLSRRDVRRRSRALLLAQALGSLLLASMGAGLGLRATLGLCFLWGACGGVAMSMARTIMQEAAPAGQRGRVMSFFSFSLMGAGPLGALANGVLVDAIGPGRALMVDAAVMLAVVTAIAAHARRPGGAAPLTA